LFTQLRGRGLGIEQIRNILKWAAEGADPRVVAALELALSCVATEIAKSFAQAATMQRQNCLKMIRGPPRTWKN